MTFARSKAAYSRKWLDGELAGELSQERIATITGETT